MLIGADPLGVTPFAQPFGADGNLPKGVTIWYETVPADDVWVTLPRNTTIMVRYEDGT